MLDRHMLYRPSQPSSHDVDLHIYIVTHYIVNASHISHTMDLDRHMFDRHVLFRPCQPRSQDIDLHMLYRHTLYRQSVA